MEVQEVIMLRKAKGRSNVSNSKICSSSWKESELGHKNRTLFNEINPIIQSISESRLSMLLSTGIQYLFSQFFAILGNSVTYNNLAYCQRTLNLYFEENIL